MCVRAACIDRACKQEMQAGAKDAVDAITFSQTLNNFSQKECRFDSRSEPMFRLFYLLPLVIDLLEKLAASDSWARDLVRKFGGPAGYSRLVGAAVVGDGMLVLGKFINSSQAPHAKVLRACFATVYSSCLHCAVCSCWTLLMLAHARLARTARTTPPWSCASALSATTR